MTGRDQATRKKKNPEPEIIKEIPKVKVEWNLLLDYSFTNQIKIVSLLLNDPKQNTFLSEWKPHERGIAMLKSVNRKSLASFV